MKTTVTISLLICLTLLSLSCSDKNEKPNVSLGNSEIYVSDAAPPYNMLKYDGNGENPLVFTNTNLAWPQDILFLEDQSVALISNLSAGNIARHNATTGEFVSFFAEGISGPTRMKIGPDNLLYVLEWEQGRILRYALDGSFVDQFSATLVKRGIGLDWDATGNLYVSSYSNRNVRKFGPAGEDLGVYSTGSLQGPTNIWFDENGNLLVVDWQAGNVKLFDNTGQLTKTVISGLSKPEGVAVLDDGRILIGNGGTGSVKMYNKDYKFMTDIVPQNSGGLKMPNAVYVRPL